MLTSGLTCLGGPAPRPPRRGGGPGGAVRWRGEYGFALNEAKTLEPQLNVFAEFHPRLPEPYREREVVFLANIDPDLQREGLTQGLSPRPPAPGSTNFWIPG